MTDLRHFDNSEIERAITKAIVSFKAAHPDIGDGPRVRAFEQLAAPFMRWFFGELNRGSGTTPESAAMLMDAWGGATSWQMTHLVSNVPDAPTKAILLRAMAHQLMERAIALSVLPRSQQIDGDKGGRG